MKYFLDSAILSEIELAYKTGLCNGITMNPSLLKKAVEELKSKGEQISLESYIKKILKIAKKTPVSIEVTATESAQTMIDQGKKIFKKFNGVAKNVVIKVPINTSLDLKDKKDFDGIIAIRELRKSGIPINCTLIFTPEQALAAAKAGANFVSPFAGRIDDFLRKELGKSFDKNDYFPAEGIKVDNEIFNDNGIYSGVALVDQCVKILKKYNLKCQVLAASIRNPRQLRECALVGADIATMPFSVFVESLRHKLTFEGMKKFNEDTPEEFKKIV
ncbi:MAG: transaldolase family protein [Candidatus Diapherotrites archaeon]